MSGEVRSGYPHALPIAARVGGLLVLVGATASLLLAFVDPAVGRGYDAFAISASLGAIVLAALFLAVPDRLPASVLFVFPALMAVLIGIRRSASDSPADGTELLFVWVVLYCGYFLPRKVAWVNLAAAAVLYLPMELTAYGWAGVVPAGCLAATLVVTLLIVTSLRERMVSLLATSQREALVDALTGLPNRRAFNELSAHEATRCQRSGLPLAVLLIDLDRFGMLNEAHGRPAGDETLRRLSELLRTQTRGSDVLARYGGGQFAILLPACGVNDAVRRAEHVRSLIERTSTEWAHPLTVSVGVAVTPTHVQTLPELVAAADVAVYAAKDSGRNVVAVAPARLGADTLTPGGREHGVRRPGATGPAGAAGAM